MMSDELDNYSSEEAPFSKKSEKPGNA